MRLLSLDFDPVYGSGDQTVRGTFAGDESLFDFDIVLWDPASSLRSYLPIYSNEYMGLPSLSENVSVRLARDAVRRKKEFGEYLHSGRTLIIVARPPQECYIATGEKNYSGTGRSRVTTSVVKRFDFATVIPLNEFEFIPGSGNRVDVIGSGEIARLLRRFKRRVRYAASFKCDKLTAVAQVSGTNRTVGGICAVGSSGGHIILIPDVDLTVAADDDDEFDQIFGADDNEGGASEDSADAKVDPNGLAGAAADEGSENDGAAPEVAETDEDEDEDGRRWSTIAAAFQEELLTAVESLGGVQDTIRPAWSERFATDEQVAARADLAARQEQVESARDALSLASLKSAGIDAKDQLFLGTGRALELEVKAVLELLGGVVTEPLLNRDDWRVDFPEGNVVVEVKGVTKSAAEKHAAQLEKWVAGAYEEGESAPKGILVVNSWRDTPLSDRTSVTFPPQMLPYSEARGHCLVSGLQLFIMRSELERGVAEAAALRAQIFATNGVLDGFHDWRSIFHDVKSGAE